MYILGFIALIYAGYEYVKWLNNSEGIVSAWLNSSFTFFAHPFVILIFLLLGTVIPNILHSVVQQKIAESGVMVREFIYKIFDFARLICLGFLTIRSFLIYEFIRDTSISGTCSHFFTCAEAFTPETSNSFFLSIYITVILLYFVFQNLPETETIESNETGITIIDREETGLYGLQPGQFAFIHTIGEYDKFQIFPNNYRPIKGYRIYKSERQRWFVIYENFFCLTNDNLQLNLGFWQLECSYEAKISDRYAIDCNKISLPILESLDQLQATIEAECIIKFREKIASEFLYQRANQELSKLYTKTKTENQSLQALSSIIGKLIRVLINIKELGSNLINQSRYTIYLYGKLFEISFQVKDIEIIPREAARIDDFLKLLQHESEGINQRLELLIEALQKAEGYIAQEDITKIMNFLMKTTGVADFELNTTKENIDRKNHNNPDFPEDYYFDI